VEFSYYRSAHGRVVNVLTSVLCGVYVSDYYHNCDVVVLSKNKINKLITMSALDFVNVIRLNRNVRRILEI